MKMPGYNEINNKCNIKGCPYETHGNLYCVYHITSHFISKKWNEMISYIKF